MKGKRQAAIIEIIEKYDIETQEELAARLQEAGFSTTQATISRDIREMKLTKLALSGGRQKYIVLKQNDLNHQEKYKRVLSDGVVSMDIAQNIIVVKTVAGMAMAVAAALDGLDIEGVVGCIAGDDTIMCVVKNNDMSQEVVSAIRKIMR
jgi:transcriptional regulator of arginine metabolism